eukprot:2681037-Prymnesium_polylepis.1
MAVRGELRSADGSGGRGAAKRGPVDGGGWAADWSDCAFALGPVPPQRRILPLLPAYPAMTPL